MTIVVHFTNGKLRYLYKEKTHFIQLRQNEMEHKQNRNMEYGLRSHLLEVVEGYGDGHRENLRR